MLNFYSLVIILETSVRKYYSIQLSAHIEPSFELTAFHCLPFTLKWFRISILIYHNLAKESDLRTILDMK